MAIQQRKNHVVKVKDGKDRLQSEVTAEKPPQEVKAGRENKERNTRDTRNARDARDQKIIGEKFDTEIRD